MIPTDEEWERREIETQKRMQANRERHRRFWESLTDEELELVNEAMRTGATHVMLRGQRREWLSASHNGWIGKGRLFREILRKECV
jgi:hypothetical protein